MAFNFFEIDSHNGVATVWLNRPQKRNFMSWDFWEELPQVVQQLEQDESVKVICFAARGASFSMGLDLGDFIERFPYVGEQGHGESREAILRLVQSMQAGFKAIVLSLKPTVAAIHRHCIGGGLDLIAACDVRFCTSDLLLSLREIKVHIVADMGSLQLLPHIIGEGRTRELALSGRDVGADEALSMGLVSRVFSDKQTMMDEVAKYCGDLAQNAPIVTRGVKRVLNHERNEQIMRGFDYVALYNSSFLQTSPLIGFLKGFADRKKKL